MERRRLGFTLVELLIAVAIFSVVAISLYSSFNAGIRVWRRAEENMELHQAVRLAAGSMAKDLRNTIDFTEKEDSEEKKEEAETRETGLGLRFLGKNNEITFVTLTTNRLDDGKFRTELALVRYFLNESKELVSSSAFQSDGFENKDSEAELLISDVEELKFEYSYQGEEEESPPVWKDYWEDQEGLPLGVKIYLKIKRKDGSLSEFSKTVYIPTGILGKKEEAILE